jgi:uncharacterized membrane protein
MKEAFVSFTEHAILLMDGMALLVVLFGTVEAFVHAVRLAIVPADDGRRRATWLRFGRWLVAGLTFQLAADIVETSISTNWDAIGRIAAVAVVRTFLNYFLERDVAEMRERKPEAREA